MNVSRLSFGAARPRPAASPPGTQADLFRPEVSGHFSHHRKIPLERGAALPPRGEDGPYLCRRENGTVRVLALDPQGEVRFEFPLGRDESPEQLLPDRRGRVYVRTTRAIYRLDSRTGQALARRELDGVVYGRELVCGPEGHLALIDDRVLRILDPESLTDRHTLALPFKPSSSRPLQGGAWLVCHGTTGQVMVVNPEGWPRMHRTNVAPNSVQIGSDGRVWCLERSSGSIPAEVVACPPCTGPILHFPLPEEPGLVVPRRDGSFLTIAGLHESGRLVLYGEAGQVRGKTRPWEGTSLHELLVSQREDRVYCVVRDNAPAGLWSLLRIDLEAPADSELPAVKLHTQSQPFLAAGLLDGGALILSASGAELLDAQGGLRGTCVDGPAVRRMSPAVDTRKLALASGLEPDEELSAELEGYLRLARTRLGFQDSAPPLDGPGLDRCWTSPSLAATSDPPGGPAEERERLLGSLWRRADPRISVVPEHGEVELRYPGLPSARVKASAHQLTLGESAGHLSARLPDRFETVVPVEVGEHPGLVAGTHQGMVYWYQPVGGDGRGGSLDSGFEGPERYDLGSSIVEVKIDQDSITVFGANRNILVLRPRLSPGARLGGFAAQPEAAPDPGNLRIVQEEDQVSIGSIVLPRRS